MMGVREVAVLMRQRLVKVRVRMGTAGQNRFLMLVLMMVVMNVRVIVLDGVVCMEVAMPLGQVEDDSQGHEAAGDPQAPVDRLAQ